MPTEQQESGVTRVLRKWSAAREAEYLAQCRAFIVARAATGEPISSQELKDLYAQGGGGMNSYERQLLRPLFDNDLLLEQIDHALENSSFAYQRHPLAPTESYDDALGRVYLPMLVERFKALRAATPE